MYQYRDSRYTGIIYGLRAGGGELLLLLLLLAPPFKGLLGLRLFDLRDTLRGLGESE